MTKYLYNDSYRSIIKTTFFKTNSEKNSISFTLYLYHDKAISISEKKMTNDIVKLQIELMQKLFKVQNYQIMHYDKKHIKKQFEEKNEIMLRKTNLKIEKSTKKFDVKMLKSFKIKRMMNFQTYKLKLSKTFKMHSVFHVNLLKFYHRNKLIDKVILSSFSMKIVI